MTEKNVEQFFYQFLLDQKKYPTTSLLRQAPTYALPGSGSMKVDLLLLDVRLGEYIGMVEFKAVLEPKTKALLAHTLGQYREMLKAPDLPTYLVHAFDEKEFQIQVFEEGRWKAISKEEFPEFETLSAKKKIEEKQLEKEIQQTIVVNEQRRTNRALSSSIWTLISIGTGVIAALLSNYFSKDTRLESQVVSIQETRWIETMNARIDKLQSLLAENRILYDTTYVVDSTKTFSQLNERVSSLERSFIQEPGKILALRDLSGELAILREELKGQEKQLQLRHENLLSKVEGLNSMVNGILFTLLTAALGVFGSGVAFMLRGQSGSAVKK
jgi:hypothetical protein